MFRIWEKDIDGSPDKNMMQMVLITLIDFKSLKIERIMMRWKNCLKIYKKKKLREKVGGSH
jgi:hypothetical protein